MLFPFLLQQRQSVHPTGPTGVTSDVTQGRHPARRLPLAALLLCAALLATAQESRLYTADDELPSSLVNAIVQDSVGYMWIGTRNGLLQFDGVRFRTYRHSGEAGCLVSNNVQSLCLAEGSLLVGTNRGLQRFDRGSARFVDVPLMSGADTLGQAGVMAMQELPDGMVVCATSGYGMFLLRAGAGVAQGQSLFDGDFFVEDMAVDSAGGLWLTASNLGVYHLPAAALSQLGKGSSEGSAVVRYFAEEAGDMGTCHVAADGAGRVYVGSSMGGLWRSDAPGEEFVAVEAGEDLQVASLTPLADGTLLVGLDGQGMVVYDPSADAMQQSGFYHPRVQLSSTKVHSTLEDREGNVWLGLFQKGVLFQPRRVGPFRYIGAHAAGSNVIGENCVMCLAGITDRQRGDLLCVGTDGDGLYVLTPSGQLLRHYPYGEGGMPASAITSVTQDALSGSVWVGSFLDGVGRLGERGFERLPLAEGLGSHVFHLLADDRSLWIATLGDGLKRYDLVTGRIDEYRTETGSHSTTNCLANMWVSCLCLSPDSMHLWVGTSSGLGQLDLHTGSWVSAMGKNCVLSDVAMQYLAADDSCLWACSNAGLYKLSADGRVLARYTTQDGLADDNVCAVQVTEGALWVSTIHGLSRIDRGTGRITNYWTRSGLQGNEWSERATCRIGDTLFFGGNNGISFWRADSPSNLLEGTGPAPLPLRVADLIVADEPVNTLSLSGGEPILSGPLDETSTFELDYADNSFALRFTTLSFTDPDAVHYRYALSGDAWTAIESGSGELVFTHLRPGRYRLRVQAEAGGQQSEELLLTFRIRPPWYLSTPAFFVYALLIILFGAAYGRHRWQRLQARRKLQEKEQQQQLNEAKLQFFISLNHEIRTPMTLIVGPLQNLLNSDSDPARQRIYQLMSRNAERILAVISQILDMRRIDKGQLTLQRRRTDMVALVKDTFDLFYGQAIEQGLTLSFHADGQEIYAMADPMNFDKVVMNLLSNAFKYTPRGGHVTVSVGTDTDDVLISVRDDGQGIDPQQTARIFQRFYRGERADNHNVTGAGIGLHLTRQLVEMHDGEISVANNSDGPGCTFCVRLPLAASQTPDAREAPPSPPVESPAPPTKDMPEGKAAAKGQTAGRNRPLVVIVEDDADIRQYLRDQLQGEYTIVECGDGREGLSEILRQPPALVISDVMMPLMDGYTLCAKIKTNILTNDVPVILLTALTQESDQLQGLSTGADAYVGKPFNIDILRQTMANLLAARHILRNKATGNERAEGIVQEVAVPNRDDEFLQRVVRVINDNIDNTELSVEMLADKVGISRAHLHRRLKELTNQGARDFIRNLRLERAAKQLAEGGGTVADVMYACGFDNPASFATKFKNLYGVSPTEYMKQHRGKVAGT